MVKKRILIGGMVSGRQRRAPRVGVVLFILSIVFFGVNFAQELLVSHQVQQEAVAIRREISQTEAHNIVLQQAFTYYSSKAYVVRRAEELGMARPKDTLLVYQQGSPQVRIVHKTVPAPAPENVFTHVLHVIFG
jgi:cell division protein FtsB